MPAVAAKHRSLVEFVNHLKPDEFDALLETMLAVKREPTAHKLSPKETKLIERINRGLPAGLSERYGELVGRRKRGRLTAAEHDELLTLTHHAETCDADRAAALVELSKLRRVPLRILMKQMGIHATAPHG